MITKKNSQLRLGYAGVLPGIPGARSGSAFSALVFAAALVCGGSDAHAQEPETATLVCETPEPEAPTQRYSTKMMAGGIVSIALGTVASALGTYSMVAGATSPSCDYSDPDGGFCIDLSESFMQTGGVMLGVGVLGLGIGIPLTIIGAKKVPVERNAFVTTDSIFIEPASNGVRIRF